MTRLPSLPSLSTTAPSTIALRTSAELFRSAGSETGALAFAVSGPPVRPTVDVLGFAEPATVSDAAQTVRVSGPVGASVRLLVLEAELATAGVPGGKGEVTTPKACAETDSQSVSS